MDTRPGSRDLHHLRSSSLAVIIIIIIIIIIPVRQATVGRYVGAMPGKIIQCLKT
jgi:hypothetical protein